MTGRITAFVKPLTTRIHLGVLFATLCTAGAAKLHSPFNTPEWKEEIAHGYLPYRRLVMADFPVNDQTHPQARIYTQGFFHYDYEYRCARNRRCFVARVIKWSVRSGFDQNGSSRKSWLQSTEVLSHEQGHLDINELYGKCLAKTKLNQLPIGDGSNCLDATDDLKNKVQGLSEQYSRDAQSEQDRYDAETDHGRNAQKQKEATTAIQARLQQAMSPPS